MVSISDRLGRCQRFPWAAMWVTVATLGAGAVIGGGLGLIPFLSTNPQPSFHWRVVYFVALSVVTLVTVLSMLAALTTHKERADSIRDIKTDYDKHILGTFEWVSGGGGRPGSLSGESGRQAGKDD